MTASTFTKTAARALTTTAGFNQTPQISIFGTVDVSTAIYGQLFFRFGRTVSTALSGEARFRLDASIKSSGDDEWIPIWEGTSQRGTTLGVSTTVNEGAGFAAAGAVSILLTSAAGFAVGDIVYFYEIGGVRQNSEYARILSISSNTITIEEPLSRQHNNSIVVSSLGELFTVPLNLEAIMRVRLVFDSLATGQTTALSGWLTTLDSLTNA